MLMLIYGVLCFLDAAPRSPGLFALAPDVGATAFVDVLSIAGPRHVCIFIANKVVNRI